MKYIFLVAVTSTFFISCKPPQGFDYRDVKNIKIEKLGFDQSKLSLDLVYFNPNNFGVDLKHVDCDIYIDNNYLGKFLLDTTMHIDKKAEFTLPSKMNIDMQRVYKNAVNLLFSKEVLITAKGNTRLGKAGIYVNVPFNYEGRHKIELFN
jgi:LEA14-like dessication related protein